VRVVIVRASDVPTYVQYGAADLGIAGKDVLLEHGGEGLYQPLDLNIAKCRMCVAVPEGFDYAARRAPGAPAVATKYIKTAREHFAAKGVHVDLIKLYGSMELAPLAGLADAIVDLVSTGGTLKANKLVEVEDIMGISSRLVVNQAALKLKRELLQPILDRLRQSGKEGLIMIRHQTFPSPMPDFKAHAGCTARLRRCAPTRRSTRRLPPSWPTCESARRRGGARIHATASTACRRSHGRTRAARAPN
jgi:ATP phosphoribosyltransferase